MSPTPTKQQQNQNMPAKTLGGGYVQQPTPPVAAQPQQPQQQPTAERRRPLYGQPARPMQPPAPVAKQFYGQSQQAHPQQWAPATFPQQPSADPHAGLPSQQAGGPAGGPIPMSPGMASLFANGAGATSQPMQATQPASPNSAASPIQTDYLTPATDQSYLDRPQYADETQRRKSWL